MATWIFLLLSVLAALDLSQSRYSLHHEDTLYLPFEYTPIPRYEYNRNAAGRVRYDPTHNFAYVGGQDLIHVIDMNDILHLDNVFHVHEPGFKFKDIALCGEYVLTPATNTVDKDNGKLFIFKKYTNQAATMPLVQVLDFEHNPKHITVSNNCQKILVSLEGAAFNQADGTFVDPEGGVAFVSFPSSDLSTTANVKVLDFTKFNSQAADYIARGVRHVYLNSSFSQDLEPEGITLRYDELVAYVTLQENNAIAQVDVSDYSSATITELYPLGYKAWHDLTMDPSDWDQDIRLQKWKVFGIYQPDNVQYFEVDNVGYLLCANEGSPKEYEGWTEQKRGQDFMLENLVHAGVSQEMKDALLTTSNLGRMKFSTRNGMEADGKYSDFYTFGGRGFSIRRADNPSTIVFDSGDLTAQHHVKFAPVLFNTNPAQAGLTMLQTRDIRSDNMGPETETVAIGTVDGEKLFFIANEKSSSVEVYSVRHGISKPIFHNVTFVSPFIDVGKTWGTLYNERNTGDLDPDGLEFISARDSPLLIPLLLVSGAISGTVSVYKVSKEDEINDDFLAAKVNTLFEKADNDSNELITLVEHQNLIMDGDLDGDHRVDKSEFFTDFQEKIGLLESKLDFVFNELDVDNNRFLTAFDTNALFYLADRDATSMLSRNQFGREYKRILYESIDLES